MRLKPLGSHQFLVEESEATGGPGAGFLVEWVADEPALGPVIEAVLVGNEGTSFVRPGVVVEYLGRNPQ